MYIFTNCLILLWFYEHIEIYICCLGSHALWIHHDRFMVHSKTIFIHFYTRNSRPSVERHQPSLTRHSFLWPSGKMVACALNPPDPISEDEACQMGAREPASSQASAASAHSAGPAPKYRSDNFRDSNIIRFDFRSFFLHQNTSKFRLPTHISKTRKV